MKRTINKAIFDVQMNEHLEAMEVVIQQTMEDKGDKCSVSQHMCVLQAINELERIVSGCEVNDFKDE